MSNKVWVLSFHNGSHDANEYAIAVFKTIEAARARSEQLTRLVNLFNSLDNSVEEAMAEWEKENTSPELGTAAWVTWMDTRHSYSEEQYEKLKAELFTADEIALSKKYKIHWDWLFHLHISNHFSIEMMEVEE